MKKTYKLQKGRRVVVFSPEEMTISWYEYTKEGWTCVDKQTKGELFMLRNNYKHYVKKGYKSI